MKVLITGGSSLLGKSLTETNNKHRIESTWYTNFPGLPMHQMDVCDQSQVRYVFSQVKPQAVIHCAANGNVDFADRNYQESYRTNVDGTRNVLEVARDYKAKFCYISTNAVYRGDHPPYSETSSEHPVNRYGNIKLMAEQIVKDYPYGWLIIRPFLLYGWHYAGGRSNWAVIIRNKLKGEQELKLVNDTIWQPTYAPDCARAIWKLLEYKNEIFNVASPDQITLYEFGLQVAKTFKLDESLLEPVDSDYFPTIAPRPRDTSYDTSKLNKAGIKMRSVKRGLKAMKDNERIFKNV